VGALLGFVLATALTGCIDEPLPHRPEAQSWDQGHLKAEDHGCPWAVYIAPQGELVQC
jgi:hypothetical protein